MSTPIKASISATPSNGHESPFTSTHAAAKSSYQSPFSQHAVVSKWQSARVAASVSSTMSAEPEYSSRVLPIEGPSMQGLVPVNTNGQRLDVRLYKPSSAAQLAYTRRDVNPCNEHHLTGRCPRDPCEFDHNPIDEETKTIMKHKLRAIPCKRSHACRLSDCFLGHVCVKPKCAATGSKALGCRLPAAMHNLSLTVGEWVQPARRMRLGGNWNPSTDSDLISIIDANDNYPDSEGGAALQERAATPKAHAYGLRLPVRSSNYIDVDADEWEDEMD